MSVTNVRGTESECVWKALSDTKHSISHGHKLVSVIEYCFLQNYTFLQDGRLTHVMSQLHYPHTFLPYDIGLLATLAHTYPCITIEKLIEVTMPAILSTHLCRLEMRL